MRRRIKQTGDLAASLAQAFELGQDVYACLDQKLQFCQVNTAGRLFLGIAASDVPAPCDGWLRRPEDVDLLRQAWAEAEEDGGSRPRHCSLQLSLSAQTSLTLEATLRRIGDECSTRPVLVLHIASHQLLGRRSSPFQAQDHVGYWHYVPASGEMTCSPGYGAIWELGAETPPAQVYAACRSRIQADDLKLLDTLNEQARTQGHDYSCDLRLVFDRGARIKHVKLSVYLRQDPATGGVTDFFGSCEDCGDAAQSAAVAPHGVALTAQMQQIAGIAGWEFEVSSGKTTWTEAIAAICAGASAGGPPSPEGVITNVAEEQVRMAACLQQCIAQRMPFDEVFARTDAVGQPSWLRVRGQAVVGARGEVDRLVGTVQDVTAQEISRREALRAHAELDQRLCQLPLGVLDLDAEGRITYLSAAACRLLRLPGDATGVRWLEQVHPDDRAALLAKWGEAQQGEIPLQLSLRVLLPGDAKTQLFDCWARPRPGVLGGQSRLTCVVAPCSDAKQQASQNLAKTRNILHFLLDAIPSFVWLKDRQHRILYVNQACADFYSKPKDQLVGVRHEGMFPCLPAPHYRLTRQRLLPEHGALVYESTVERGEQTLVYHGRQFVAYDEAANLLGTGGIAEDVTRAQIHERKFRNFFALSLDLLCIASFQGYFIKVNPVFSKILGFSEEELLSRPLLDFVHPDDRAKTMDEILSLARGNPTAHFANRYLCTTGEVRHLNWVATPEIETGLIYAAAHDVTDYVNLDRAVQALRHSLDAYAVVIRTDAQGRILEVNDNFCRLTLYQRDEVEGKPIQILNSGTHASEFWQELWQTVVSGGVWRGEIENRARSGARFWVDTTISPVLDGNGVPLEYVVLQYDITNRKRVEQRLVSARRSAEEALETKTRFLANMSHEIRTPLNGILGIAKLLCDEVSQPTLRDRIGLVVRSGEALLKIIDDILDFSSMEAGCTKIEAIAFDLETCIREVHALLVYTAQAKGLALEVIYPEDFPKLFVGDPLRLRQIVANLVSNALKFTSHGSVRIEVSIKTRSSGRRAITISVIDTGIGIPKEAQSKLFRAFSQVDGSSRRTYGGSGLGLSICKGLIELMGGHITLESSPDLGSRFDVFLTLREADEPAPSQALARANETFPQLKLLVAEDNETNQIVAQGFLQKLGIECDLASNGQEAVQKAFANDYDVVLMDCHMPEMDGIQATEHIRAKLGGQRPLIIALTASAMNEDRRRCRDAGMDDFLAKPLTLDQLVIALRRVAAGKGPAS